MDILHGIVFGSVFFQVLLDDDVAFLVDEREDGQDKNGRTVAGDESRDQDEEMGVPIVIEKLNDGACDTAVAFL